MILSHKAILGSVFTVGCLGLIIGGAFVMNQLFFLDSDDIIVSNALYHSAPDDGLQINEMSIVGSNLRINVSYGGGCQDHVFKLIASDEWLESHPVRTPILFSHEANDDVCEAYFTEIFLFNLLPLKERYQELYQDTSATIILLVYGGVEPVTIDYTY